MAAFCEFSLHSMWQKKVIKGCLCVRACKLTSLRLEDPLTCPGISCYISSTLRSSRMGRVGNCCPTCIHITYAYLIDYHMQATRIVLLTPYACLCFHLKSLYHFSE